MSRGATARLFAAVELPATVREELLAWTQSVAGSRPARAGREAHGTLRVLEAASLHLTLCFLGSRPVEEIVLVAGAIAEALEGYLEGAPELSLGAPLWLPPKRPRALAIEVRDDSGSLLRLQGALAKALAATIDCHPERRRFKAHITVARMRADRSRGGSRAGQGRDALPPTPQLRFSAPAVALYRSWLSPHGARYEAIARLSLTPASAEAPGAHADADTSGWPAHAIE
jgi:2'-5' RNA ligase